MPTEQSSTPKEGRRTTPIRDSKRTMARNQHRHHRTFTKVKWNECYSDYCQLIYKDNLDKSNNNEYLIGRNSKNLQRRHLEATWSIQKDPKQQRTAIYIKIHGIIHKSTGNKETTIDSIPSSNRWSNGKNQSRDRNVSMTLCELPTG